LGFATFFAIARCRSLKKQLKRPRHSRLKADNASVSSLRNCRGLTGAAALNVPPVGTRALGSASGSVSQRQRGIWGILQDEDAPPSLRKASVFPFD
jgi:hypothetical protein